MDCRCGGRCRPHSPLGLDFRGDPNLHRRSGRGWGNNGWRSVDGFLRIPASSESGRVGGAVRGGDGSVPRGVVGGTGWPPPSRLPHRCGDAPDRVRSGRRCTSGCRRLVVRTGLVPRSGPRPGEGQPHRGCDRTRSCRPHRRSGPVGLDRPAARTCRRRHGGGGHRGLLGACLAAPDRSWAQTTEHESNHGSGTTDDADRGPWWGKVPAVGAYPTGSGDAFLGAMLVALDHRPADWPGSLRTALGASAASAEQVGTAIVDGRRAALLASLTQVLPAVAMDRH